MKLIITETTVQDSTVPVRWCLEKEELKQLQEMGIEDPQILIVVNPGWFFDEERYVVPVDQAMQYVQFRRPGENTVTAAIYYNSEFGAGTVKEALLARNSGGYGFDVLEWGDRLCSEIHGKSGCAHKLDESEHSLTVTIPEELFAKEPSRFEGWWVNLWFERKPRDQCQFRRRRFLAYTIQPFLVVLWAVPMLAVRFLIALGLLILGYRRVKFKAVVRLFKYQTSGVWWDVDWEHGSVFNHDADGNPRPFLVRLFQPGVLVSITVLVLGIGTITGLSFLEALHAVPTFLAAIIGSIIFGWLVGLFMTKVLFPMLSDEGSWLDQMGQRKANRRRTKREQKLESERIEQERQRAKLNERYSSYESLLACDANAPMEPTLEAVPKQFRTVRLRYQALKAKVCKPFAR